MKKITISFFCLGLLVMGLSQFTQAQNVDVDNRTICDFTVKANTSNTTTPPCPFGVGPLVNCPAGVLTTLITTPPPSLRVIGYGVEPTGSGLPPAVVARPTCGPNVVTVAGWCAGAPVTLRYMGRLLIIQ